MIVGLLGVYFRESFRKAVRQKTLASKLEAQLHDFFDVLLQDPHLLDIWSVGEVWRQEGQRALLEKGVDGFRAVQEKYRKLLEDVKTTVCEEGSPDVDAALRKQRDIYRRMPERIFQYSVQSLEIARESINSSVGFISEDEAAEISWDMVYRVVSVRNSFLRLIHNSMWLLLLLRETEDPDLSEARRLLYSIVEGTIRMSAHLTPVKSKAAEIRRKSLVTLTLENALGKP